MEAATTAGRREIGPATRCRRPAAPADGPQGVELSGRDEGGCHVRPEVLRRHAKGGGGIGVSRAKLSEAQLEILVQLPEGTTRLKETCVHHLGLLGQMSAVRDIDAAWTQTKKRAAREYPDKFALDDHGVLHWAGRAPRPLDRKISRETFVKLNEMAEEEGSSVNALVSRLIKAYRKGRA